jgi:3-methylfumaryl-CoA hydratase
VVQDARFATGEPLAVHVGAERIDSSAVRRFAEAHELDAVVYEDDAAARAEGFPGRIAPWSMAMVAAMPAYWQPGDPPLEDGALPPFAWDCVDLPGRAMMSTRIELVFERPLRPGDLLHSEYRVTAVTPKRTKIGTGHFVDFEVSLLDEDGELVAVERSSVYRYDPNPVQP